MRDPAAQRRGVRRLIATTALELRRQTTWTMIGGLIGGAALAAALARALLATPFGALISQIVHVTDPVAALASLGLIVAVCLLAA
jgi:hypothetical protein